MRRFEQRQDTIEKVRQAAISLFHAQGYEATTISAIAKRAGVSVGTVTSVGTKDALFLEVTELMATEQTIQLLAKARTYPCARDRLSVAMVSLVESAATDVDFLRDYLIANLRCSQHNPNKQRVSTVITGIARLWEVDTEAISTPAHVGAEVLYSVYTTICVGLASGATTLEEGRVGMSAAIDLLCGEKRTS